MRIEASRRLEADAHSEWFDSLSPTQQSQYLELHPNSKFAKDKQEKKEYAPVKEMHKHDVEMHKFFHGDSIKPGSKLRRSLGSMIKSKAKGVVKRIALEVKNFKAAGTAAGKLLTGKDVSAHEKEALKEVLIRAALVTTTVALTGGMGLAFSHLLPHLADDFMKHTASGIAEDVLKHASTPDTEADAAVTKLVLKFADYLQDADLQ